MKPRKYEKKKCESCQYRCTPSSGASFCQYLLITGKLRMCPGGNECTEYVKGRQLKDSEDEAV